MTYDGRIEAQMTVPLGVNFLASNAITPLLTGVFVVLGSYYPSQLGVELATVLNGYAPSGWTVSLSTGPTGTLQWTINCTSTPWTIRWANATALRDILGFTGDIISATTAQTGASQGRGLWTADCPLFADQDPRAAPIASDLRTTTAPTGRVLGLTGDIRYRHTNVTWSFVPKSRIWEAFAGVPNASWEFFFNETQLGRGSPYYAPSSKVMIYDHTGAALGNLGNFGAGISGWWICSVTDIAPGLTQKQWVGAYSLVLPELSSSG